MRRLRLTTAGESHGPGLTATLLGMPAGLRVDVALLARDLARRQHGFGRGRRMQIEADAAEIRGGVRGGVTLGSPLVLWIANRDYANWEKVMGPAAEDLDPRLTELRRLEAPRPGHADLAGGLKYLRRDLRDVLERASARETAARVAAGAFAKMLLGGLAGIGGGRGGGARRAPSPRCCSASWPASRCAAACARSDPSERMRRLPPGMTCCGWTTARRSAPSTRHSSPRCCAWSSTPRTPATPWAA